MANHKKAVREAVQKVHQLRQDFISKFKGHLITAISAAFALVIALSWNDAIKQGVDQLIAKWGITGTSYLIKIFTALLITGICVGGIYLISKLDKKENSN